MSGRRNNKTSDPIQEEMNTAAPVLAPKTRLELQRETQDAALALLQEAIGDLLRDKLNYPSFEERAQSFLGDLPLAQQTIALHAVDGAIGRLISAAPRIVGSFTFKGDPE